MTAASDADRAKAAEIVADWQLHFDADQTDVLERMIETRLAAARAEGEADRADLLHQLRMLTTERDNLDQQLASALTAESAADQRWTTALHALAEELEGETTDATRLAKVYKAKERWGQAAIVEAKAWTSGNAAARVRAVAADTGKPDTSSEEE